MVTLLSLNVKFDDYHHFTITVTLSSFNVKFDDYNHFTRTVTLSSFTGNVISDDYKVSESQTILKQQSLCRKIQRLFLTLFYLILSFTFHSLTSSVLP